MKLNEALAKTNWPLLADQKQTLIQLLSGPNRLFDAEAEHLQGILNWIDALQDAAEGDGFPVAWI